MDDGGVGVGVEDIFPVDWFLDCVNDAYNTNLTEAALPTDGSNHVVKRVEVVLKDRGRIAKDASIDKAAVLTEMQKRFETIHKAKDFPKGTAALAKKLVTKINSSFAVSGRKSE